MGEHPKIWLLAWCADCAAEDRCWCEDDTGPCDDCGRPCVEYTFSGYGIQPVRDQLPSDSEMRDDG